MKIDLGAYQFLEIEQVDLGDQYTNGGSEPRTVIARLTTPMDVEFENKFVTALLSEEAQRKIIDALQSNLNKEKIDGTQ